MTARVTKVQLNRLRKVLKLNRYNYPFVEVRTDDLNAVLAYIDDLGDLPAARDRVLNALDRADGSDIDHGHWISTAEIRNVIEGDHDHTVPFSK